MKPPAELPASADSHDENAILANSEVLTREEFLRRRARQARQLAKFYRDFYWALMEDLKLKHREYYWKFGKSPIMEDESEERENGFVMENGNGNGSQINGHHHHDDTGDCDGDVKLGSGFGGSFNECFVDRCQSKAMPLTRYCHPHILLDPRQTLYKRCKFVITRSSADIICSADAGTIQCSKPILRSTIPSLCTAHVIKTEKAIKQALKKGGLSVSSSAKLAPKFQCVISEYVCLIQNRRRAVAAKARGGL